MTDFQKETSDSLKINRVCRREKLFKPQTTLSCRHRHPAYFDDMFELTAGGGVVVKAPFTADV